MGFCKYSFFTIYKAPSQEQFDAMMTVGGQIEPRNFYAIITRSFIWVKSLILPIQKELLQAKNRTSYSGFPPISVDMCVDKFVDKCR
jgi:hypothetical protein